MNIIGKIKGFFFSVREEPRFPEKDVLTVKQRAETLARELNESLNIANQSKSKRIRDERLQIARELLVELKKLAIKFPFLRLENLQAVESSILAVEAETSSHPTSEEVGNQFAGQHPSTSNEQAILMSIQSCFRVANESIEIARKSKNLETKVSRLDVARSSLKEAQRQANQFSLKVDGFAAAEAEINRIDDAIRVGTPTEIEGMPRIEVNDPFASPARDLLKEATALKKEKKYIEACDKLREAYLADGAENLMIEERLRLPMYLQLAGKNDEGWDELNRLDTESIDQFSQPKIAHQMKIFLRKEKNETAMNPVRVFLRGDSKPLEVMPNEPRVTTLNANAGRRGTDMRTMNNARLATLQANADIVPNLRWLATLDGHTCILCGVRDGMMWDSKTLEPIGHALAFSTPPLHDGCRCVLVGDMGLTTPGMRASSIGPIDMKTTFSDFLERMGPEYQDDVLGEERAALFRSAKLTLQHLVDESGKELTLAELRAKYSN